MEENRKMIELLEKLNETNRAQARWLRIQSVLTVVMALFCLAAVVLVWKVAPQVNTVLEQTQSVLTNMESVAEEVAAMDLESMVDNVDTLVTNVLTLVEDAETLVTEGQTSLETTMEKLNAVDFETLNKAIEDLSDIIEPIANFFNKLPGR